jgi:hypothetical protein
MSTRAQVILRRTYNRPLNDEGTLFETWSQTLDRVINHQKWLWERTLGKELNENQLEELAELRQLIEECKVFPAGRVLWLGGTEIGRTRESSLLNCAFINVETICDLVDVLWNLLQGCFHPDTKIQTSEGILTLREFEKRFNTGEEIIVNSFNEELQEFEYKPVLKTNFSLKQEKLELTFDDGSVFKCTEDHEFLTKNRGYVKAVDLLETDIL